MKKKISIAIFIAFTILCNSQEKKEGNKIFFVDFLVGGSTFSKGSVNSGYSVNYQNKKDLFTLKFNQSKKLENDAVLIIWFLPLTYLDTPRNSEEFSFLYGKRFIKNGFSYSSSIGISLLKHNTINQDYQEIINSKTSFGIPLEFNVRWFRKNKRQNHILGFIPVGKETGFGSSTGLKVFATISKQSYIGLALNFGFGFYKNYQ